MSDFLKFTQKYAFIPNKDIYELLENMADNLEKLFESIGVENGKCNIKTPHQIVKVLQTLLANGILAENIDAFNEQIKLAIKKNEETKMDAQAAAQRMNDYEGKLGQSDQVILQKDVQIMTLQAEVEQMRRELDAKTNEIKEMERRDNEIINQKDKTLLNLIESFILFRDSIILREGLAANGEAVDGKKLLASLLKETAGVLQKNGVTVLDEKGQFDSSIQIVTDVTATDKEELHETVSEVFRPGYVFEDKMLRPQEVILYKYSRE